MTALRLAAAIGVTLLAACSTSGWDGAGSEAVLRASLLEAYPGSTVRVECADRVHALDRCAAEVQGVELSLVLVEQPDGAVGYDVLEAVVATADIEALLAEQLGTDLGDDPVLNCGDAPVLLAEAGSEVRCVASVDARRHEVVAVLEDAPGSMRILAIHPDAG